MHAGPSTVLFTGQVSIEYGGGFASIRSSFGGPDLTPCEGICLRRRGWKPRFLSAQ